MKIPKIIYNNRFLNAISWFMKIGGITLFPWIILREVYRDDSRYKEKNIIIINHESIHIAQQREMLILPFFIMYILEFIFGLIIRRNVLLAYKNISFEREAYTNEKNLDYLKTRKWYSFFKYL